MAWTPNIKKGVDLPVWDWLNFFPQGISYHGTAQAWDGARYLYYMVQTGTTATTASTTTLWRYDTWTEGWQYLATTTSGNRGIDLEYDAIRNVLILIHGTALTSWQVFNLNTTATVVANVTCQPWVLTTMSPVLPLAADYAASLTIPDDLGVIGSLTVDGSTEIDGGVAAASGNTTTTIVATTGTATFGGGMVGLMVRVTSGTQSGQRRIITAVTNNATLTVTPALPGALASGDTFSVEVPEHVVSAATTTTITNSASGTWVVNMYRDQDVVMITGALAGQRRRIASNTADTLTLATAVTGNPRTGALGGTPSVGDVFRIVPSSDFLYYQPGTTAPGTGIYRIDLAQTTGAAWSASLAAMPAAIGGGGNTFYAGKYDPFAMIVLRGNATATMYRFQIGTLTWTTLSTYAGSETFTTGSSSCMLHGKRKLFIQKESSQRCYAYDLTTGILEPAGFLPYAAPGAYDGKRAKYVKTPDGVEWVYMLRAGGQEFFRVPLEWMQ